eukprot:TRINITY_DN4562_c0_g2_i1.p1 TRINITY_DN4562_c0_g2~~TRINITY_DN4562_c0_g2_i1.p1  ORF type:complete len:272 (+),score=20.80 TRINITY_DN4562_c0_g2_i1:39-854(+)
MEADVGEMFRLVLSVVLNPRYVFTGWCFLFCVVAFLEIVELLESPSKRTTTKRTQRAGDDRKDLDGRSYLADTCVIVATLSRFSHTSDWSLDWWQWPKSELLLFSLLVLLLIENLLAIVLLRIRTNTLRLVYGVGVILLCAFLSASISKRWWATNFAYLNTVTLWLEISGMCIFMSPDITRIIDNFRYGTDTRGFVLERGELSLHTFHGFVIYYGWRYRKSNIHDLICFIVPTVIFGLLCIQVLLYRAFSSSPSPSPSSSRPIKPTKSKIN